jgi:transcriptional accessory protein Tex/SPT6|tara:strand:- start:419 stop:604 length:186 start_codon:yes stop_codon:yes gene_type:complete
MEISSHQQTHVHVDKTSPVARVNVMHNCVVVELENNDQLYVHISSDAIQKIAAKATEYWES